MAVRQSPQQIILYLSHGSDGRHTACHIEYYHRCLENRTGNARANTPKIKVVCQVAKMDDVLACRKREGLNAPLFIFAHWRRLTGLQDRDMNGFPLRSSIELSLIGSSINDQVCSYKSAMLKWLRTTERFYMSIVVKQIQAYSPS